MEMLIKVGMADLKSSRHPCRLITIGLGSCVGIALYDPITKISGLAHIMLPSSLESRDISNVAKFADTAVIKLLEDMVLLGAGRSKIVAKLAGGASMFSFDNESEIMGIGARNIEASRNILYSLKIPILAEDVGGNYGRTVELNSNNGKLLVKTFQHGIKEI